MKAYLKQKHELKKESLEISLKITQKINELFDKYNLSLREHFPRVNDGFSQLWLLPSICKL